jgi:uncharacterized protein YndB with AHSA1/START domain
MNDHTALRLEQVIAAPPAQVFALWTEPNGIAAWWGPEGFDVPSHAVDVRPGGHWNSTLRAPDGAVQTVSGIYRFIEPPHRLVFTWGWDDDDGMRGDETEVTVTFAPAPSGTHLALLHAGFESAESRDRHQNGWTSSLARFARLAETPER